MRTIALHKDDKFSTLRIEQPPLSQEEIRDGQFSAQFLGSEGSEWLPPTVTQEGDATVISFESWVFGLMNDERFTSYAQRLADQVGAQIEGGQDAKPIA